MDPPNSALPSRHLVGYIEAIVPFKDLFWSYLLFAKDLEWLTTENPVACHPTCSDCQNGGPD